MEITSEWGEESTYWVQRAATLFRLRREEDVDVLVRKSSREILDDEVQFAAFFLSDLRSGSHSSIGTSRRPTSFG
jgi:inactivated superfamily I helicase